MQPGQSESLRERIKRLSGTRLAPHDLAEVVFAEIKDDPALLRDAVRAILPGYCADVLREERRQFPPRPIGDPAPPPDVPLPTPIRGRRPTSKKMDRISVAENAWWNRMMSHMYNTETGWTAFGDCTQADLAYAAKERRSNAAANLVEAERLERLAAALVEYSRCRVSELPHDVVSDIMERAA